MINKNQYKVRNVKKVLHKVGKNWLVVSTALLGLVAGGAAAGTATHADTTPVNANHSDGYVNHPMTQSAGSASPQLVHSDGTSLASASAGSSVASNNVSPSASKSTMSSVAPSASSQENNVNSESIRLNHRTLGAMPKSMTSTLSDSDNYLNLNGFNSLVSQMVTGYFPYPEFSNYIENKVYKDIANNRNVNDFISEATSQVDTCFRTAPRKDNYHLIQPIKDTINNTLSSLGKSPEFSDEYSSLSEGFICPFLRNLGSITSDNLVAPLSSIASYTSVNAGNIPGFGEIASDTKSLANNASLVNEVHQHHINEFNNEASKINNQHFVKDTINAIVNLPAAKAKSFDKLCSDLTYYINSPKLSSFVANTLSNSNLSAFTDSYANSIHKLLNLLNNSDVEPLYKKDYDQFHENRGINIQRLLVKDLSNIAGNNNEVNVAKVLNDFNYSITTWGLTANVPWMKTIYNGINNYLNLLNSKASHTNATKLSNTSSSVIPVHSKSNSTSTNNQNLSKSTNNTSIKSSSISSTGNSSSVSPNGNPKSASSFDKRTTSNNSNGSMNASSKALPNRGNNQSTNNSQFTSDDVNHNSSANFTSKIPTVLSRASNTTHPSSVNPKPPKPASSSDKRTTSSNFNGSKNVSSEVSPNHRGDDQKTNNSQSAPGISDASNTNTESTGSKNAPSNSNSTSSITSSPSSASDQQSGAIFPWVSLLASSLTTPPAVQQPVNVSSSVTHASTEAVAEHASADLARLNQLSDGQQINYHGMQVTRQSPQYSYFEISKGCLAHNTLDSVGEVKDYGMVLRPGTTVRLDKIFKVNVGNNTLYRYEINVHGHDYFVTGNHQFTNDANYQTADLKSHRVHGRYGHRYYEALVQKPFMVYDSPSFKKDNQLWKTRRGQMIDIKGIHKVGKTVRLALVDGTFITANRADIKLL